MIEPFGARRKLIAKRNELAKDPREDFDDSQPRDIPEKDNNSYLADDEIIWEEDAGEFSQYQEDDAEFSLSQCNDNYEVYNSGTLQLLL